MTTDELESRAEQIKVFFLTQITELSNSEAEVVVEYLLRYFEESLELLQQERR